MIFSNFGKKLTYLRLVYRRIEEKTLRLFIYVFVTIITHYTQSELTYKQDGMEPQLGATEREFVP